LAPRPAFAMMASMSPKAQRSAATLSRYSFLEVDVGDHGVGSLGGGSGSPGSPAASGAPLPPKTWSAAAREELAGVAAVLILIYAAFAYNVVFLGRVLPSSGKGQYTSCLAGFFNGCLVLTAWCWLRAHVADAGSIPESWRAFVEAAGDSLCFAPVRRQWQPGLTTYCRKCVVLRPERTHHCKACDICVLRMDHHCPFVKNCIGFNNYKFFLLLLAYGMLLSFLGFATTLPDLVTCVSSMARPHTGTPAQDSSPSNSITTREQWFFIGFGLLSLVMSILLQQMAIVHFWFALRNQTQLENGYDNMVNPYDQGTAMGNLSQVLGEFGPDWFVPIAPLRPLSDGVSYRRGDFVSLEESQADRYGKLEGEALWRIRYHVSGRRGSPTGGFGPETACTSCLQ